MPTRFLIVVSAAALCAALPARADKRSRFTAAPPQPPAAPAAPRPPPPPRWDDDDDDDDEARDEERSQRFASRDDRDDDDDDDEDDRRDGGARVYRMDREKERIKERMREKFGRRHDDGDDDRDEDEQGPAKATGRGSARLAVSGPVTLQLRASAGDIEMRGSDRREIALSLSDAPADDLALYQSGDRVEVTFRGRRELRRGKLRVEVPKGTRVDLSSMSGDLGVDRVSGDVRIRTMSGDVKLGAVGRADVQTVSGDVRIEGAAGPVRVHTVSGKGIVNASAQSPQLEFESASGDLEWTGACGRDCHVAAETVSGDVKLNLDPKSSFELSYTSHTGELRDELNLAVKHAPKQRHGGTGGWLAATYGKGEGVIECDAFSGSLVVRKR